MMIVQEIYLKKYDWDVLIFYGVDSLYTEVIMDELYQLGYNKEDLASAERLLKQNEYNVGLTMSNFDKKASIVVIGVTDSTEEFNNTYDHEKGHLAMHICTEYKIDPFSEEYQYLAGEIAQLTFPVAKNFLCEECKERLLESLK